MDSTEKTHKPEKFSQEHFPETEGAVDLMLELANLGQKLQLAMRDLIEPLTGLRPRPNDIGEVLSLDRTQSWRLSRMMSDECPYTILYESPAPKGLGLIIDAARRAGSPQEATQLARQVVQAYETLLHKFPEGRTGLDGALSAKVPKAREAANKKALRQVSIGMSQLLGLRATVRYVSGILVPSEHLDTKVDVVAAAGYVDLRRLRIGPSPVVFSGKVYTRKPGVHDPALETLDGDLDPDPRLRLLHQFGSIPPEALTLEPSGDELRLVLASDFPQINTPITIFFGQRIARSLERYQTQDRTHEVVHHAPVLPADINIFDTIIHKDLYHQAKPPKLTIERFGFNPSTQSYKPDDTSYRMDDEPQAIGLGMGIDRINTREIPQLKNLQASVFKRIKHNPNDFYVYRTTIEYLPPGFAVTVWIPLDEKPNSM